MAKRARFDEYPINELCVETNDLLNLQYYDLSDIITHINQHDAPDSESANNEYLAGNYDPEQFNIYIEGDNETKKTQEQEQEQEQTSESTAFVKYGRGYVSKSSAAYLDLRKRNNEAIHRCRNKKQSKDKDNKSSSENEASSGNKYSQTEIIEALLKEIKFLKDFLGVLSIDEDKYELNSKIQQLNDLLKNISE